MLSMIRYAPVIFKAVFRFSGCGWSCKIFPGTIMNKIAGKDSSKEVVSKPIQLSEAGLTPGRAFITEARPPRSTACRLRDATVLLVAVEGLVKDLLFMLINDKCGEVRDAASAAKGLELFGKREFDLVVVDEGLPDLNRAGFLAGIRKGNPKAAVALVGTKTDGAALDPAAIRADALIGLPLDMDRLASMFCKAVNGRRGIK